MDSDSEDPLPSLFRPCLPLLLSLLDDTLIVGLSRLGCEVPWLKALSPLVVGCTTLCTTLYLVIQFYRHGLPGLINTWQEFQQPDTEVLET
ncbi:hypothetical protein J5X98_01380 [Leptothermofonsia sichuanensis E412]|uniref:hypothetical protein n=1 Tax=Leptothermofonsia sichuanensis TaxID=2917832 RepID=UPI001CA6E344|nr:hypothetical protein [Leptothermofonsia sichuanensis]QZZ21186.1 hypothetical protein J5X98_01380 [Leptothermofonsia sichuanensis E412]